jgi:hypothetical protein
MWGYHYEEIVAGSLTPRGSARLQFWRLTYYNGRNLIRSHEVARPKYSKHLTDQCDGLNRSHFTVASDPMRIVSVPYSLKAASGVV